MVGSCGLDRCYKCVTDVYGTTCQSDDINGTLTSCAGNPCSGGGCQPPGGATVKCNSTLTACTWNTSTCGYDCVGCQPGYSCVNGYCVSTGITQYTVTMTIIGNGTVVVESSSGTETLSSSNTRTYSQFDVITYNAIGYSGYQFSSFSLDGVITTLPNLQISAINSNKTIMVIFTPIATGSIVLNSVEWVTPSAASSQIKLNVTTNGSTSTYLRVDADAQQTVIYLSSVTSITTTGSYSTAIPHGIYIGTPTPTQYKNLLQMGYDCANCSTRVLGGAFSTTALCTAGCAVPPTKYSCSNNCVTPIASGTFPNAAACTTGCAVTGGPYYSCNSTSNTCVQNSGTVNTDGCTAALFGKTCPGGTTTPCASDEMLLFGNCQKKNTVYIVGIALFALIMMKSKN